MECAAGPFPLMLLSSEPILQPGKNQKGREIQAALQSVPSALSAPMAWSIPAPLVLSVEPRVYGEPQSALPDHSGRRRGTLSAASVPRVRFAITRGRRYHTSASPASRASTREARPRSSPAPQALTAGSPLPPVQATLQCRRRIILDSAKPRPIASGAFTTLWWTQQIPRPPRSASLGLSVARAARHPPARACVERATTAPLTPPK